MNFLTVSPPPPSRRAIYVVEFAGTAVYRMHVVAMNIHIKVDI
jgi:hypothetical protein